VPFHLKTHNDLDAAACRIILEAAGNTISSTSYHDYNTIDESITYFIKNKKFKDGDTLVIADICPTQGVCEFIDRETPPGLTVDLIDHHKTRDWANKYKWAKIAQGTSAAALVFDKYYREPLPSAGYRAPSRRADYEKFVEAVTAWDLWQLSSPERKRGENLNSLLGFIGKDEFTCKFVDEPWCDLKEPLVSITKFLITRRDRYVLQVIKDQLEMVPQRMDGLGNKFKVIFCTDFHSEVGHAVLMHPDGEDLDYVCIVNPVSNSCSMRSRTPGVDISRIAKIVGGGGHNAAAGFPADFTKNIELTVYKILNSIDP